MKVRLKVKLKVKLNVKLNVDVCRRRDSGAVVDGPEGTARTQRHDRCTSQHVDVKCDRQSNAG